MDRIIIPTGKASSTNGLRQDAEYLARALFGEAATVVEHVEGPLGTYRVEVREPGARRSRLRAIAIRSSLPRAYEVIIARLRRAAEEHNRTLSEETSL